MPKTTKAVTIEEISLLLDQKFKKTELKFDSKLEKLELKVEANFTSLHEVIAQLRKDMNKRFDKVNRRFDQNESDHQEILDTVSNFVDGVYKSTDKRITKLERKVFPGQI